MKVGSEQGTVCVYFAC